MVGRHLMSYLEPLPFTGKTKKGSAWAGTKREGADEKRIVFRLGEHDKFGWRMNAAVAG